MVLFRFHRSIILSLALLAAFAGCRWAGPAKSAPDPIAATLTGRTMGTTYRIHLVELPERGTVSDLRERIVAALETINDQMSTYRPESEISRFNASRSSDWFPVSKATAKVVAEAQRISRSSNGAFDVTVMPLVNLWSFGPERRPEDVPSDAAIARRKARVGYQHLDVRLDPPALRKSIPELQVDLSAIAKGYGVDVVAELIAAAGVDGYMVLIGGEVRTQGRKADGAAWNIALEKPVAGKRLIQDVLQLKTAAVASSGDYRNFFREEGVRYSHTIDPRTGRPVTHSLVAASVFAEDCMTADARATTVMVMGPDEGYNWLVEQDAAAILFVKKDEGFEVKRTPAFEARFGPSADSPKRRRSPPDSVPPARNAVSTQEP